MSCPSCEGLSKNPFITFLGLPMPPSSNHGYATVIFRGRTIRVKSKELKIWQSAFDAWVYENMLCLPPARTLFKRERLGITCNFFFEEHRVFSKNGSFKKLDVTNRVKHLHDSLAAVLHLDDSSFFESRETKGVSNTPHVNVTIEILPK